MTKAILVILAVAAAGQDTMSRPPPFLIEEHSAAELDIAIGDTVLISGLDTRERRFIVAGTYRRPADPSTVTIRDYRAVFQLPDLEELLGTSDRIDRFSVKLRPGANRRAVIAEIDRLAFGADALPTDSVAAAGSETFRVVSRFHRALAGITITGAAVFLFCLVVLKIEERRLEGAAMRDVGISRRTLFVWMFVETVAMATVGTGFGLVLGWAGSGIINLYFQGHYSTTMAFARVTPPLAALVAVIGLVTGTAVGVLAGLQMVRTRSSRLRQP